MLKPTPITFAIVTFAVGALAPQGHHRTSIEPPQFGSGKMGQDLFVAIGRRDVVAVNSLLAKGADPMSRNGLGFTPLHIAVASFQPDVAEVLIAKGAKPDAESLYGGPLQFAALSGNAQAVERLLALGVSANGARDDETTVLMAAASSGSVPAVQALIAKGARLDAQNDAGSTALMWAARRGHLAVGTALADAGAKLDLRDKEGQTALMGAAMVGDAAFVKFLVDRGANVDLKDAKGRTAAMLAARYAPNPKPTLELLHSNLPVVRAAGMEVKRAATAGLTAIQRSMAYFAENTQCLSCHHEGLGRMALAAAKSSGLKLDPRLLGIEAARSNGMVTALRPVHERALVDPAAMKNLPLIEINDLSSGYTWFLAGMASAAQPKTPATAAMAMTLAKQQSPEGCWTFGVPREPMQSSFFTFTALAVRDLRAYGPSQSKAEIDGRIARARKWLATAPTKNSEDRAFRLLGLKWAGADPKTLRAAAADVARDQRSDGGWSQLPGGASDAYATGQAVYALIEAGGYAKRRPEVTKGVSYLLSHQDTGGSWFVNKRTAGQNNYFDAKFPYGESQYSSFNGSCWATMALTATLR